VFRRARTHPHQTSDAANIRTVFDKGVAAFAKPTTWNIFYCNGALGAPNDGLTGPVAAQHTTPGFRLSRAGTNRQGPERV
jgi:hypothetical protein